MIIASVLAPWALLLRSLEGRFRGSPVPPCSARFVAKLSWTKRSVGVQGGPSGEWGMPSWEDGSASCGARMLPMRLLTAGLGQVV